MYKAPFRDREAEIAHLEKEYRAPGSGLVVVYGRRRVGKTALLKAFGRGKPFLYFLADRRLEVQQVADFGKALGDLFPRAGVETLDLTRWEAPLKFLASRAPRRPKVVVVLDEFQYLAKVNPAFPSILQRVWDERLKARPILLILCGSLIRMMYNTALRYDSPLYGRRTSQMRIQPLSFAQFSKFYPGIPFDRRLEIFGVIGGIPRYLEAFPARADVFRAIEENVFDPDAFLHQEPRFLLNEEIGETATYFSLLQAIAEGRSKTSVIAGRLGLSATALAPYLEILRDLGLVERRVPITERPAAKSRQGRYRLTDRFFLFWFRFVLPFQGSLEIGRPAPAREHLRRTFASYLGQVYEEVSLETTFELARAGALPFDLENAGRWWNRAGEIDLVGLNSERREILFGECRWTDRPVDLDALGALREKAKDVDWNLGRRREHYILFSKSGFSPRLRRLARKERVTLVEGNRPE